MVTAMVPAWEQLVGGALNWPRCTAAAVPMASQRIIRIPMMFLRRMTHLSGRSRPACGFLPHLAGYRHLDGTGADAGSDGLTPRVRCPPPELAEERTRARSHSSLKRSVMSSVMSFVPLTRDLDLNRGSDAARKRAALNHLIPRSTHERVSPEPNPGSNSEPAQEPEPAPLPGPLPPVPGPGLPGPFPSPDPVPVPTPPVPDPDADPELPPLAPVG